MYLLFVLIIIIIYFLFKKKIGFDLTGLIIYKNKELLNDCYKHKLIEKTQSFLTKRKKLMDNLSWEKKN